MNREPKTIIDTWKQNWSIFLIIGFALSIGASNIEVANFINQIEIHYRLFLMMLLATLSFGGFLLTLIPSPLDLMICAGALIYNRRTKLIQRNIK